MLFYCVMRRVFIFPFSCRRSKVRHKKWPSLLLELFSVSLFDSKPQEKPERWLWYRERKCWGGKDWCNCECKEKRKESETLFIIKKKKTQNWRMIKTIMKRLEMKTEWWKRRRAREGQIIVEDKAQTRAKKREKNRDKKQRIHLQKAYRRLEPVARFKLGFSPQLTSSNLHEL